MNDESIITRLVNALTAKFENKQSNKKNDITGDFSTDNVSYPTVKAAKEYIGSVADNKVDKETGKGLSSEDFTSSEKTKLANIESEANKTVVDSALSSSSTNPVQNKVIKSALDNMDLSELTVTVEKQDTADNGYLATYVVKQNGSQVGSKINIPKDLLFKSATVETVTTANSPVEGYNVGETYFDFVINTEDNSGTANHIYLNTKELGASIESKFEEYFGSLIDALS